MATITYSTHTNKHYWVIIFVILYIIIMIIKNFSKLASNSARHDALLIAEAGYHALDIRTLFTDTCSVDKNSLCVGNLIYDLKQYKNIYLVGVGKGSALAAHSLVKSLPRNTISQGVVIDIRKKFISSKVKSFIGTHPLPSQKNIAATNKLIELLSRATAEDLVIVIVCGGGSSLSCQPANNLTYTDLQLVSDHLLKSGATIDQINTVRKHLSLVHGGFMAKYAYPATVVSLIVSDVPGNDLQMVASGPTVLDKTKVTDAQAIAKKFGLPHLNFVETPKEHQYFTKVTNVILAAGSNAVRAMQLKSQELGYQSDVYSESLSGLANRIGPDMASRIQPRHVLLACGETQVIVTSPGKGGRNQDLALSALPYLPNNSVIIACASDGKDNIPVAGGITDSSESKKRAIKICIDATASVASNQSYKALKKLNGIFQIKPVTANVSDFVVVLRQ